jgi:hypothetical protein
LILPDSVFKERTHSLIISATHLDDKFDVFSLRSEGRLESVHGAERVLAGHKRIEIQESHASEYAIRVPWHWRFAWQVDRLAKQVDWSPLTRFERLLDEDRRSPEGIEFLEESGPASRRTGEFPEWVGNVELAPTQIFTEVFERRNARDYQ